MEVYILNSLLQRIDVVDDFISLIWTERFNTAGDFQMTVSSTLKNRKRLQPGTRLGMSESYRVMTIEYYENTTDDDGNVNLIVKGPSLEDILDDRVARSALSNTTDNPTWNITDTPKNIAKKIFHDICVTGVLSPSDVIPMIHEGSSFFPDDTIDPPSDTITYQMDPMSVYSALTQLCQMYNMGIRLFRLPTTGQLWFDIYMGSDRTTGQADLPPVIFSTNFDNLTKTTELRTMDVYKNVAYVCTPVGDAVVYPDGVDSSTVTGLDRRVLVVNADDITDTTPSVALARIIQRGKEELAKYRQYAGFDGEITEFSQYKYQRDYWMGDLVEVRGDDGNIDQMQVTEVIFASDEEGERSYPTLTLLKFITPGTWSAWDPTEHWSEVDPALVWLHASD